MYNEKYLITVVIPVYNVEKYIDEAMDSIINQSIGFEKIEVLFVDDSSKDNSKEICMKYVNKYSNVKYIFQKNMGVSAARNNGIDNATGKYINFLDADDKWNYDAFEKAIYVLEKDKKLNLVSIRRKIIELQNEFTQFDYMFYTNRKVNITENYDCIQVACTSVIFKTKLVKKYKFDTKLKISEDAKFMLEIMLNEKNVYLLSDTVYYYRIRQTKDSAIQKMLNTIDWYSYTSKNVFEYSFNYSKKYTEK